MPEPTNAQSMRLIHLEEQGLASMQQFLPDIKRIAYEGPSSDDDKLVQMVCCHMAAKLLVPNP